MVKFLGWLFPIDFTFGVCHRRNSTGRGEKRPRAPKRHIGQIIIMRWHPLFPVLLLFALFGTEHTSSRTSLAAEPPSGDLWVFAVGVSQYRNSTINLEFADNDAEALARALQVQSGKIFRRVNTKVLVNQQASRQAIIQEMRAFFSQAAESDVALIALMGHGVDDHGSYYFLPSPADLTNLSTEGLPLSDLEAEVRVVGQRVGRLVLVIDTCHSGDIAKQIRVRGIEARAASQKGGRGIGLAGELAPKVSDAYILSSSKDIEESLEDASYRLPGEAKGHGAFTYALLRGLRGEADRDHVGVVNVLDLFTYASNQVPKITGNHQTPYFQATGTNFPLARTASPAKADDVKEATALLQQGREQQQKGNLAQAETTFARAQELNPRDELPELLHEQVKEEQAYRSDSQKQRDIIDEAQKLVEASRKGPAQPDDPWSPRPMVVTFLDFNTLGGKQDHAGLHEVLVQRVAQALAGTKRVQVVERHLLDKVMEELKLSMSDLSDPATRLKIGRILVARFIATGDIVFVSEPRLAFNLRVIDTETTEIKINLSKDSTDPEKILATADEIAASLAVQLQREYPMRGKILSVEGDEVILNIGTKHGVIPGVKMRAIVEEPVSVNGEVIAHKKKEIGTIEITAVEEKASFARVVESKGPLAQGTKVIETLPAGAK